MPKPEETAVLYVKGQKFEDWETVWVQHRWLDGYPSFRFTAAENIQDLTFVWADLKFKPGDSCRIELGGQPAFVGVITKRQTAYDATSHAVELSGAGEQWLASTSSVPEAKNNFDKKNLLQITKALYEEQFGVKVEVVGTISDEVFDRVQAHPGEKNFDLVDRLSRHRTVFLGTNPEGAFLLIGNHTGNIVQNLIEGENIKKMQCIISNENMHALYSGTGQTAGTDEQNMRKSSELKATAKGKAYRFMEVPVEQPVKEKAEVQMRVNYDAIANEGTEVTATVTVQGWLRDGKKLWRPGDNVYVYAPMALLNMAMKIKVATFTQDNQRGTQTELEVVLPWALNDAVFDTGGRMITNPKTGQPMLPPKSPEPAKDAADTPAKPPPAYQSDDPNKPNYVPPPPPIDNPMGDQGGLG